jgi:hypothetical protein
MSPSPLSRTTSSDSITPYGHILSASRKIEAHLQTQRSRLSSILSICTVSGADEFGGLKMAHDRCAAAVEELLDQEEDLEEMLLNHLQEQQFVYDYEREYASSQYSYPDTKGYGYSDASRHGYSDTNNYGYPQERRPSIVDVAN